MIEEVTGKSVRIVRQIKEARINEVWLYKIIYYVILLNEGHSYAGL